MVTPLSYVLSFIGQLFLMYKRKTGSPMILGVSGTFSDTYQRPGLSYVRQHIIDSESEDSISRDMAQTLHMTPRDPLICII